MRVARRSAAPLLIATLLAMVAGAGAAGAQVPEQRVISGTVADSGGRLIPYANVVLPRGRLIVTNAGGEFSFGVPGKDRLTITVRRLGFRPVEIKLEPGGDTTLTVVLEAVPQTLQTSVIQTERMRTLATKGFYSRIADRERGTLNAEFITPEEIERWRPSRPTQLLEQRNGLVVRRVGSCNVTTLCWAVLGTGGCVATVYLDGKRLNPLGEASSAAASTRNVPFIDDLLSPTSIAGIEVYPRGAQAPPQYQSLSGSCAVVLIWTR